MKENLTEIAVEMLKSVELELSEPVVEILGNISEFTHAKSNALEQAPYYLR